MTIQISRPSQEQLDSLGVFAWPTWGCEPSTFDWSYEDRETCYLLEGKVTVEADGTTVAFGKGDLVVFPRGLKCVWKVAETVKKHYRFG